MTSTDVSPHGKSKFYVLSKGLPLQALYVKTTDLFDESSALRELTIYCWDKNVNKKCFKSNMSHYGKKNKIYYKEMFVSLVYYCISSVSDSIKHIVGGL